MNDDPTVPAGTVTITTIDSHTGGEPTRVIVDGFPPLRAATLAGRRVEIADRHRRLATAIVDEPRGNEAMVAALLTEPVDERCATGVVFFDRTMVLGMCGHGTIGLVETLYHLGRIGPGDHFVETPVGVVSVRLGDDHRVTLDNVPSRRLAQNITVHVPARGPVTGDIADGGNIFFLVTVPAIDLDQPRPVLLRLTHDILDAVHRAGHRDVDHIELYGPPTTPDADSRNFVLCPSGTYDRSPCGTGTSAKIASLAASGALSEGEPWVQESITGSTFTVHYRWHDQATGTIIPTITGTATITGRTELYIGPHEYR